MPTTAIPILQGDKIDVEYRDNLLVNMTAINKQVRGANGYISTVDGVSDLVDGVGADRGGVYNERFLSQYRVSGSSLIEINNDGTITTIGNISGNGQCSFAQSFNTQAVVTDGNLYLYDPSNGLVQVTDSDLGNPISVTWIDGYYFFTDGEFLFHTDINDETSIDPLKFATSEFSPDKTKAVDKTSDNQVIAFNRFTTEFFVNRATENFAFQRLSGQAVRCGIVGTHAVTEMSDLYFTLGNSKGQSITFNIIRAGSAQGFSNREIDKILAEYTESELSTAILESRRKDQQDFVICHLPRHTLLYNHTIAGSYGSDTAWSILKAGTRDQVYSAINGVFDPRLSKWIYGHVSSKKIGYVNDKIGSVFGVDAEVEFYSPLIQMGDKSIDKIEIAITSGFVDNKTTVAMSRTEDGVIYGRERWQLYSNPSDYNKRFIAHRVGYVKNFVGLKYRAVSGSKLSFSNMVLTYA